MLLLHAVPGLPLPLEISSTVLYAQEQATKPAATEVSLEMVREYLRKLEDDELEQRDAAERRLIELGPAVLKFLPEATPRTSGELKVRLQRIRQQLQALNIGVFFKESRLTLSGKMTVAETIAEISKQSGNLIELANAEGAASIEIQWDTAHSPFWQVMAELMQQAKLRVNPYSQFDGLSLMSDQRGSSSISPPTSTQGPFHIEVVSTQTTINFQSQMSGQLDVSLLVTWEPRLKPVFLQIPMAKVGATIKSAPDLAAINPQAVPEVPINSTSCSTQIDLQLARPLRTAQKLDQLQGELVIAVPGEKHKYIFKKFGNGARQSEKFGEVNVVLEGTRRNGPVYEMRVLTEFKDPQGALDSFRGWILSNRAYLLDAKDNRLENVGLQTYAATADTVGVAFLFQISGDPNDYKLVYESPAMITRQTFSFELKEIDLP